MPLDTDQSEIPRQKAGFLNSFMSKFETSASNQSITLATFLSLTGK
jgi:hypothetical protein